MSYPKRLVGAVLVLAGVVVMLTQYVNQDAHGLANGSDWAHAYLAMPATLVQGVTYATTPPVMEAR